MEMAMIQQLVGHEDVRAHLRNALASGKISQAYLFAGEEGSGRRTLAKRFAMALNCTGEGEKPCMQCESCRKALGQNHPDIITVQHEKPKVIRIDEIRDQILQTVDILPYESPKKVYLIPDADKMNPNAQNALLKTIEEPPSYAVFLLIASGEEALLPTIRSRCVKLHVKPLPDDVIEEYLMTQLHVPDYEAKIAAAAAQGNIGRARAAIEDEKFGEITADTLRVIRQVQNLSTQEFIEIIKQLKDEKENVSVYLDLMQLWFRDVLLYKATADANLVVFKQELSTIREQASGSSYEGLQKIMDALENAKTRLRANVSFELTMELLFLTIRENCQGSYKK